MLRGSLAILCSSLPKIGTFYNCVLQITFSRDWLAGSGKRSGQVTFSRDWLAGSGKRSLGLVGAPGLDASPAELALTARQTIETLIDYLATQITVIKQEKIILRIICIFSLFFLGLSCSEVVVPALPEAGPPLCLRIDREDLK